MGESPWVAQEDCCVENSPSKSAFNSPLLRRRFWRALKVKGNFGRNSPSFAVISPLASGRASLIRAVQPRCGERRHE